VRELERGQAQAPPPTEARRDGPRAHHAGSLHRGVAPVRQEGRAEIQGPRPRRRVPPLPRQAARQAHEDDDRHDARLPTTHLKELTEAGDFWKGLGARTGADIILSGVVDFRVENKSGYRSEEYISPIDGRKYYRQVNIDSTGFSFDVTVLAMDGRTGARLFQENFRDTKEKNQRSVNELAGLFENLFSLENQLLGLFVVREREANRYVFD
jgi:hypothetical protein